MYGCLMASLCLFRGMCVFRLKVKKGQEPPLALHGQLLWREFFYTAATNNPNFDKMSGNSICVQIPWDHNPEALAKWAEVSFATSKCIHFINNFVFPSIFKMITAFL